MWCPRLPLGARPAVFDVDLDIGQQFGRHRAGLLEAIADCDRGDAGAKEKLARPMAAQNCFRQKRLDTWAVNIPYAIYDEWRMPQIFKGK
jgi:hypothetical protein